MGRFDCPHCGRPGVCPPGTCLVRDDYNLHGAPKAPKASKKMPAAVGKAPKVTPKPKPAPKPQAKPKRYTKREVMALWEEAGKADRTLVVTPIPADYRGSRLSEFTIRISGSEAEIKATLGKLKTLLRYESGKTRIDVGMQQLTEKGTNNVIPNAWTCYITIHERA